MKCIKKHGEIKRVWDRDAREMVETKGWEYCPKSEWKMKTRKSDKNEKTATSNS